MTITSGEPNYPNVRPIVMVADTLDDQPALVARVVVASLQAVAVLALAFMVIANVAADDGEPGAAVYLAPWMLGYLVPSIISVARRQRIWYAVLIVNVLFGWTVIGWIGALVMGLWPHKRTPIQRDLA